MRSRQELNGMAVELPLLGRNCGTIFNRLQVCKEAVERRNFPHRRPFSRQGRREMHEASTETCACRRRLFARRDGRCVRRCEMVRSALVARRVVCASCRAANEP